MRFFLRLVEWLCNLPQLLSNEEEILTADTEKNVASSDTQV